MFVVTKERLTWFNVQWKMLDEQGVPAECSFRMKAELLPLDKFEHLLGAFASGSPTSTVTTEFVADSSTARLRDIISEVGRDWEGVVDESQRPLPFTPKNLSIVIQQPGFIVGWTISYITAWNGQGKAREKNSEGSPAAGPAAAPNRRTRRARQSSSRK